MSETQWMFFGSARKLDVSQLLAYYNHSFAHLYSEKALLDSHWLETSPLPVSSSGPMVAGLKHMDADNPDTWGKKDLLALSKLLVRLSLPELEALPASGFNSTISSSVLSPLPNSASWLDYDQLQEGAERIKARRGLAEFFLLGNHPQVNVVEFCILAQLEFFPMGQSKYLLDFLLPWRSLCRVLVVQLALLFLCILLLPESSQGRRREAAASLAGARGKDRDRGPELEELLSGGRPPGVREKMATPASRPFLRSLDISGGRFSLCQYTAIPTLVVSMEPVFEDSGPATAQPKREDEPRPAPPGGPSTPMGPATSPAEVLHLPAAPRVQELWEPPPMS